MKQPVITKEMIEYLERIYPEYVPSTNDSLQYVFFMAGKRSLVKHVREVYERQQKEIN